jgi:hypothetical protein
VLSSEGEKVSDPMTFRYECNDRRNGAPAVADGKRRALPISL